MCLSPCFTRRDTVTALMPHALGSFLLGQVIEKDKTLIPHGYGFRADAWPAAGECGLLEPVENFYVLDRATAPA